ncbi:MAG: hypothetical protein GX206_12575 [Clostridiales bacterium]|nr:hypothetical protein [Clostridiales bacterium]
MLSEELKGMVADNCPEYQPHVSFRLLSNSSLISSCESCKHWEKGRCSNNYFHSITEALNRN